MVSRVRRLYYKFGANYLHITVLGVDGVTVTRTIVLARKDVD